jgi:uncharacterized protein YpuA (DUF1002 family)
MPEHQYKHHPILDDVLKLALRIDESINFDDYAVEQIENLIKDYSKKPDFSRALNDLITFSYFLEKEQKNYDASAKVMNALENVSDFLKSLYELKD